MCNFAPSFCPDGGIGRRAGLKHQWINLHAGSIPALGTRWRSQTAFSTFFVFVCSDLRRVFPGQWKIIGEERTWDKKELALKWWT